LRRKSSHRVSASEDTDAPRADRAQYLATWLAVLKADKKVIFTAASKASEAAAFLAALQGA
jgi:antirestriction protein ArdC